MLLAFFVDLIVWQMAKSVSFNDEDSLEEATPMNPKSITPPPSTPVVTEQTPTPSTTQVVTPMLSPTEGEPSSIHQESQSFV